MTSLAHRILTQMKALSELMEQLEPDSKFVDLARRDLWDSMQKVERIATKEE